MKKINKNANIIEEALIDTCEFVISMSSIEKKIKKYLKVNNISNLEYKEENLNKEEDNKENNKEEDNKEKILKLIKKQQNLQYFLKLTKCKTLGEVTLILDKFDQLYIGLLRNLLLKNNNVNNNNLNNNTQVHAFLILTHIILNLQDENYIKIMFNLMIILDASAEVQYCQRTTDNLKNKNLYNIIYNNYVEMSDNIKQLLIF